MNRDVLKSYLKKRLIWAPVFIVIFLLLHYFITDKFLSYIYAASWLLGLILGYFQYIKRLSYLADLEKKGVTEKEVNGLAFVEQWKENRERGLFKYCIIDGAIVAGALLSLIISLIGVSIFVDHNKHMFSDGPGEIFQFIGITYLIGAAIGAISYRITWAINQKRFNAIIDQIQ
jgi:hypothetical protein